MRCLSQAFGLTASFVAFDAFGVKRSNYSRFHTFFNSKKKEAKNAALMRREAGTAQIAFVVVRHALACEVGCKMDVGCEMALRAVRDGFV